MKPFVDANTKHLDFSPVGPMTERRARLVSLFEDTLSMIKEKKSLADSVERSISGTKYYPESESVAVEKNLGKMTKISVTTHRTFQAAELVANRNPGKRVAVLNFASAACPGGGVTWGSSAQEECLCRSSTLYPVLNREKLLDQYYNFHRSHGDAFYTDACIYSPDIKVIKSDALHPVRLPENKWFDVDVVTCAAPNLRKIDPPQDSELRELHIKRGRKILDVALDNGVECLVLGAFGCGAFRNNPWVVSRAYAQLMKEYKGAFDEVEFAVFCKERDMTNYEAFKKALDTFVN